MAQPGVGRSEAETNDLVDKIQQNAENGVGTATADSSGDQIFPAVPKVELVSTLPAPANLEVDVAYDTVIATWEEVKDTSQTNVKYRLEGRKYFAAGSDFENASTFKWLDETEDTSYAFSTGLGRYQLRVTAIDANKNGYTQTATVVSKAGVDTAHIAVADFEVLDIGPDNADNYYSSLVEGDKALYYWKMNDEQHAAKIKNYGSVGAAGDLDIRSYKPSQNEAPINAFEQGEPLFGSEKNTSWALKINAPDTQYNNATKQGPSSQKLFSPNSELGFTYEFIMRAGGHASLPLGINFAGGVASNGTGLLGAGFHAYGTLFLYNNGLSLDITKVQKGGPANNDSYAVTRLLPTDYFIPGQIYHVAVALKGGTGKVYVNGLLAKEIPTFQPTRDTGTIGNPYDWSKDDNYTLWPNLDGHENHAYEGYTALDIGIMQGSQGYYGFVGDRTAEIGHVAHYLTALSEGKVKLHYDAMLNGKPKNPEPKPDDPTDPNNPDGPGDDGTTGTPPGGDPDTDGNVHLVWVFNDLPDGTKGKAYDAGYGILATGGSPIVYTASKLPPGLKLNAATGKVTGKPTTVGTYSTIIYASCEGTRIHKSQKIKINKPGGADDTKTCSQTAVIGLQTEVLQQKLNPGGHEYTDIANDKTLSSEEKTIKIKSLIAQNDLTVTLDDLKNDPDLQDKIITVNKECDTGVLSIFIGGGPPIVLPPGVGTLPGDVTFRIEDGILYVLHNGQVVYAIQIPSTVLVNLPGGNGLTWWFDPAGNLTDKPDDAPDDYIVPGGTWYVNANYKVQAGVESPYRYALLNASRTVLINPDLSVIVDSEIPYDLVQQAVEKYFGGRTPGSYYRLTERAKAAIVRAGYLKLLASFHSDTE